MNQIKFRAWDGKQIRYDVTGFEHGKKNEMAGVFLNGDYYAINETPIMQFTGLLDCEGKEVYEGDVLEYKEYHANIKWWSTVEEIPSITKRTEQQRQDFRIEKNIIRFDNGSFCLGYTSLYKYCRNNVLDESLETGRHHHCDYEEKQWDFKVIGNLYEHPNLLNNE